MKKTLLILVLIIVLAFVFAACEGISQNDAPAHTHTFDQKNVGDGYLKSAATQDAPATYYYSCICGEKGSETFMVGSTLESGVDEEHVFQSEWTTDDEKHWLACIDLSCDTRKNEAEHTFGVWVVDETATCMQAGTKHRTCVVCGKTVNESYADSSAHNYATFWSGDAIHHFHKCQNSGCTSVSGKEAHNFVDGRCACGGRIFGAYTREGDYIYFGEYPQTIKSNDVTVTSTTDSRGYYLGSDGAYYAKVTATPCKSECTFSTGETVTEGNVYYFKVEPIRWRILSEEGNTAFLLCDSIIANRAFEVYSYNNYAESDIRAWLNAQFYNTAFNALQKEIINTVLVDNSANSTALATNPYACENTNDKVFLLSNSEAMNSAYGFISNYECDTARIMKTSDFSRASGAWMDTYDEEHYGNGWWRLRSLNPFSGGLAYGVSGGGENISSYSINATVGGVVPALQIRLN